MSNYSLFSSNPEVRGSNSQFEPNLYNKVGGVSGCTGAINNVNAAKLFPGYNYIQKGGRRKKKIKGGNSAALGLYSVNPVGTDILQAPNGGVLGDPKGLVMKGGSEANLPNFVIDTCQNPQLNQNTAPSLTNAGSNFVPYSGTYKQTGGKKNKKKSKKSRKSKKSKKSRKSRKLMRGGDPRADPQNYADGVPYYGFNNVTEQTAQLLSPGHAPIQLGLNTSCASPSNINQSGGKKRKLKKYYSRKKKRKNKRKKSMKGGKSQFLSNIPYSASYSTAGVNISPSELALANPPPYTRFINCPGN